MTAQHVAAADWISGGGFGPEVGVVGIGLELVVIALMLRWARGRTVARRGRGSHNR